MNLPNFTKMSNDELMAFWSRYTRPNRKEARELVGQRTGYVVAVQALAGYACNLAVRRKCAERGDDTGAAIYDYACNLSLGRLPTDVREVLEAQVRECTKENDVRVSLNVRSC